MKKSIFIVLLLSALGHSEQLKTTFNPHTGSPDFVTALSTTSIAAGSGIVVSTTSSGVTISASGSAASNLQVTRSGVQITSPTASINFYSGDFLLSAPGGTTAQIYLNPATTDFIRNTSSLQSGATFYVSSGTAKEFSAGEITILGPVGQIVRNIDSDELFLSGGTDTTSPYIEMGGKTNPGIANDLILNASQLITLNGGTISTPNLTPSQFVKTDVSSNLTTYDLLNGTQTWTGSQTFSSATVRTQLTVNGGGTNEFSVNVIDLNVSPQHVCINQASGCSANFDVHGSIRTDDHATAPYYQSANNLKPGIAITASGANYGFVENRNATSWDLGYGSDPTILGTQVLRWDSSPAVNVVSSMSVLGANGLNVTYGIIGGSVTASNLASGQCVQTGSGGILTVTGSACSSGGGGSAAIAFTTGTSSGFTGPPVSSPTFVVIANSTQFIGQNLASTTFYFTLNSASVTLQGNTNIGLLNSTQTWTGGNTYSATVTLSSAVVIPNGSAPTVDAVGKTAFDTTAGQLLIHDGSVVQVVGSSTQTFTVTISSGIGWNGLKLPIWRAPTSESVTIIKILAESLPAATTVQYALGESAFGSINTSSSSIFSVAFSSANNTGVTTTSFNDSSIASQASIVLYTPSSSAAAGTPDSMTVTVYYKKDRQ